MQTRSAREGSQSHPRLQDRVRVAFRPPPAISASRFLASARSSPTTSWVPHPPAPMRRKEKEKGMAIRAAIMQKRAVCTPSYLRQLTKAPPDTIPLVAPRTMATPKTMLVAPELTPNWDSMI